MLQSLACIVIVTSAMPAGGAQSGAGTFLFLPAAGSISVGQTLQFTAYKGFTSSIRKSAVAISNHVQWFSSNASGATISNTGLATGVGACDVNITGRYGPFHGAKQSTVS